MNETIALHRGFPIETQAEWLLDEIWARDPFQRQSLPCWQYAQFPCEGEKPLDAEEIWGDSPT